MFESKKVNGNFYLPPPSSIPPQCPFKSHKPNFPEAHQSKALTMFTTSKDYRTFELVQFLTEILMIAPEVKNPAWSSLVRNMFQLVLRGPAHLGTLTCQHCLPPRGRVLVFLKSVGLKAALNQT